MMPGMTTAQGIHAHPQYKLGRRPPKNAPAIEFAKIWTGVTPAHPITKDLIGNVAFGLDGNDQFGDCGPTSCDNLCRAVSAAALDGRSVAWTQDEVFALYRLNNPELPDPPVPGGPGDQGVDMQTMLELWQKHGAGHDENGQSIKPVAFAKIDVTNESELNAAVATGGLLWGVDLETAQQQQTDAKPPRWDFKQSGDWGGHAIYHGRYDETTGIDDVISWAMDVQVTHAFRQHQLQEAWLVILPWHVQHPVVFNVIDFAALAAEFKALTGKDLPVPSPPQPGPAPAPGPSPIPQPPVPAAEQVTPADRSFWAEVRVWATSRHLGTTRQVAMDLRAWAKAKGLT